MAKNVTRLYEQFKPEAYVLELAPDREKMSFSGSVTITGLKTGRPSMRLSFHQSGLRVDEAVITRHNNKDNENIFVSRINHHKKFEEVRLHATKMVYPGQYTIKMRFSGNITRAMSGIYPCFFDTNGVEKIIIATQFESHHAREVFPCIDEPEAKATFDLKLSTPVGETAISNTPIKSMSKRSGLQLTEFETSPLMSTYLLAFVFGDLTYKEATTKGGVVIRTYATAANVSFTEFALDTAVKCLEFYNNYFGIDYPLKKCDLVALPDFAAGAMENWGCITFREQTLLVDPNNTTLASKQYVAMVVAHELAHQWFGNLVTMRWWTDLWLNEGFASWIEFLAVDHIFPEWQMWTQFAVDGQQQALRLDALEHTHPIEVSVNHPDEIRSIFDAISYSKGASIIHMLHEYLGPDIFRAGLTHYLKRHEYGNTDTIDLWQALEEASNKPVKQFMHAWTSQPGFPLIQASVSPDALTISQQRFFLNPEHDKTSNELLWPVPLLSAAAILPSRLDTQSGTYPLANTDNLRLNNGQSGFYRVAYNSSHLQRLGELIRKGKLEPIDRMGILSDVFETARNGSSSTADALHFLNNFKNESNYAVWDIISSSLGNLRLVMNSEKLCEKMKPFVRSLTAVELRRLGWVHKDNEEHFDQLLRPIVLGLASFSDEKSVVKRCRDLFDSIEPQEKVFPEESATTASKPKSKNGINIDPDLRGVVFGTIARTGDKADFKKLVSLHNNSTLSEEKVTLSAAITGFKDSTMSKAALSMITTKEVRLQDVPYWIAYSFLNRHARKATWDWFKDHWNWLEDNLGSDLSFYRLPIYVARVYSDRSFIEEYKKFFEPRLSPALMRSYKQGVETLQWQSAWRERSLKEVSTFFKSVQ